VSSCPLVTSGGRLRWARGLIDVVDVTVLESLSVCKAKVGDRFRSYVANALARGPVKEDDNPDTTRGRPPQSAQLLRVANILLARVEIGERRQQEGRSFLPHPQGIGRVGDDGGGLRQGPDETERL
jgi:hypothetical protein